MSQVTEPILLDSTGKDISAKLQAIVNAINGGTIDPLTVTQNGTYTPSGTTLGYGPVTVDVQSAGSGNAYAYTVPPTASVGENGEYYFELDASGNGIRSGSLTQGAMTSTAGWEFTARTSVSVIGLRAYARNAYTGTLVLGTTSAQLVSKSVQTIVNDWAEVMLDAPIQLTAGENYIVMLFGNTSTLSYDTASNLTFDSRLSYVRARYGSFPGNTEANYVYSADIIIGDADPPYPIRTQYYKTGGVWVAV